MPEAIIVIVTAAIAVGAGIHFEQDAGPSAAARCRGGSPRNCRAGRAGNAATVAASSRWNSRKWLIQQKAEGEKELRKARQEMHERDRILDRRQDTVEKQAEQIQKQEKIVESTQRKLTEKIQDMNRRKEELSKLLDLQRQTLHELSGLNKEEATTRLLEDLDRELKEEAGAVILRNEKRVSEVCEEKAQGGAADGACNASPRRTRPKPPPARSTSPTTR